jgi:2-polyprenyl-3-methyl-5-hydroxy-6-metoxy-1,4-benzoquinol methylase
MHPLSTPRIDASLANIAWDECACLLCGLSDFAPLLESADPSSRARFLVVRCKRCGLCFTNPRPDFVSMQAFYRGDYRCHQHPDAKVGRKTDSFAKLLPPRGRARLLDFGCGAGAFLDQMRTSKWNVTGLDSSETAIARIRERGLTAEVGTFPQSRWQDASFDAITMWQSLEHVHDPLDVLREAHRLLTPDGTLVVAVPNFDGWGSRIFGADWYGLDLPRHLTHFTPTTLSTMLKRAGFPYVEMRQELHHSWIRHSARKQAGAIAAILRTRLGSSLAGWWGKSRAAAEGLMVLARKSGSDLNRKSYSAIRPIA